MIVETIRRWNDRKPLDESIAHWMCVDAMSITSRFFQQVVPTVKLTRDFGIACRADEDIVFDPVDWMRSHDFPEQWSFTSDSISAAVAVAAGVDELVLLKSANLPRCKTSIGEILKTGLVDSKFAGVAGILPMIRIVNLRSTHQSEQLVIENSSCGATEAG